MKVNSAKEYRLQEKRNNYRPEIDEDFMGCSYDSIEGHKSGFFNMFHGMKDNIERYLPSLLNIAEDNQAIYEFLQNAVDCNATHFWAFYNDQYFLAVNNGAKFSVEGLTAILNIAQSTKTDSSSIGRLGIGFKLAHRLVGKGNGVHELIYDNKGPIMFSWDNASQLRSLMSSEEIIYEGIDENAFLLKIAITNFPANAGEVVRDVNYKEVTAFTEDELREFREYTTDCLESLFEESPNGFNQGTLFFIKLGENKRQLLDKDLATLKNGIEYSMNTLKQLENICFNGEIIYKKKLQICESSIAKDTDVFKKIEPEYSNFDILYSFGFLPLNFTDKAYYKAVEQLRQSPNFYKYFPMGDEVDNMALFVHSDSFEVEANRRKLTNDHTNRELLPEIASFIVKTLSGFMSTDRQKFLQLFASILLTDKQSAEEKNWMNTAFFDKLFAAIKTCIPTLSGGVSNDVSKVKIKKMNIDIPLDQIGHADKQWFAWTGDINKELLEEAIKSDKLGIESWNINSIIENSNISLLNEWLGSCDETTFDAFINEIKSTTTTNRAKDILPHIKLFKIGNERKSQNEIEADCTYLISTAKTALILPILEKVGMKCTMPIESHPLSSLLTPQSDKVLFSNIKTAIESGCEKLSTSDKFDLVTALATFEHIEDESIRQIKIFKNKKGDISSLGKLASYKTHAENWQLPYIICQEENFPKIQMYLVSDESFYQDIIVSEYDDIFEDAESIDEIYSYYQAKEQSWDSSLTIKLINKYGATLEVLSLIEKTLDKDSVEAFVKKLDSLPLSTSQDYANDSFEYRCIKLAAKVECTLLKSKITVDEIKLSEFASSDMLSFKIAKDNKEKTYRIRLSDVLPNDTQCAIYGKIVAKFSSISNYTTIFSADSSNLGNVSQRLQELLTSENVLITPAQYFYILLDRGALGSSSLGYWDKMVRLTNINQIVGILAYCYEHDFLPVLLAFNSFYKWNCFIREKYLFSDEWTLAEERADKAIETWCGNDENKKKMLKDLGMHFNDSYEIKRRIAFKNDSLDSWNTELKSAPLQFLNWVNSIKPISGSKQKQLLLSLCQNDIVKRCLAIEFDEEEDYAKAEELDTVKYQKWRKSDGIQIYVLDSEMPCRIVYKNGSSSVLSSMEHGEYKCFSTKHLYIKATNEEEIAAVLAKVYSESSIPFSYEDYVSVCFDSLKEQHEKDELIKKLKEQITVSNRIKEEAKNRKTEEFNKEYSERVSDFMGDGFSMPKDEIHAKHIIARYRALMYVKEHATEFAISSTFDEKEYVRSEKYAPIPLENGKSIHVQGAGYGIWYMSPGVWDAIVNSGHYACLCTGLGDNDFKLIRNEDDIREIAESSRNILLKMSPTKSMDIMDTIKSVLEPESIELSDDVRLTTFYSDRDVHLMLKVHQTPEAALNSIFDGAFNAEGDFNLY